MLETLNVKSSEAMVTRLTGVFAMAQMLSPGAMVRDSPRSWRWPGC